jgi:hypothetical protein
MPITGDADTIFVEVKANPEFKALAPQDQADYLSKQVVPVVYPEFNNLPDEQKQSYMQKEVLPQFGVKLEVSPPQQNNIQPLPTTPHVSLQQGLGNVAGALWKGGSETVQALTQPQTWQTLGNNIKGSVLQEAKSRLSPPRSAEEFAQKTLMQQAPLAPGAISGIRDLVQGALSLPAETANTYLGKQVYDPAIQLPEIAATIRKQYPVSAFAGEQVPYLIPVGQAAQAGHAAQIAKAAAEGAAIGFINDPQGGGLEGRAGQALYGAALPTAAGVAGHVLGKGLKTIASDTSAPIGLAKTNRVENTKQLINALKPIFKPEEHLQELHAEAQRQKSKFINDLRRIAAETQTKVHGEKTAVKTLKGTIEKYHRYGGQIPTDILRSTLVIKSPEQVSAVLDSLEKKGYKVLETDNLYENPRPDGYRHIAVKLSTGDADKLVKELQLIAPKMLEAKGRGHLIYDQIKAITGRRNKLAKALADGTITQEHHDSLSAALDQAMHKLNQEMKKLYDEAYARDSEESGKASISSKAAPASSNAASTPPGSNPNALNRPAISPVVVPNNSRAALSARGVPGASGISEPPSMDIIAGSDVNLNPPKKLPFDPEKYFNLDKDTVSIPLEKLNPVRARETGIQNANTRMDEAYQGTGSKRDPIDVAKNDDGTYTILDGNSTYANAKASNWESIPVKVRKRSDVITEEGTQVTTRYKLSAIDEIVTSHNDQLKPNPNYPEELQPRDRSRAASGDQVDKIAQKLNPALLGESVKAGEGAPIVGKDMAVESGNGRIMALRKAYAEYPKNAENYKAFLKANAEKFGYSADQVDQIKNPVLVRVRTSDTDRVKFAQEANIQGTAAMGPVEQAQVDSKNLSAGIIEKFNPSEDGNILVAGNKDFNRDFLDTIVGSTEKGRYVTAEGDLSQDGISRIKRAIFAKAYGKGDVLERMAESTDDNVRNMSNALLAKAGEIVKLKLGIENGDRFPLDISDDLVAAVNKLSQLRDEGKPVKEYLGQHQLISDGITPFQKRLMDTLDKNKRSAKKIGLIIQSYVDQVHEAGNPNQKKLIEAGKADKQELFARALKQAETGGQGSLFEKASERQAREAKVVRMERKKEEQRGQMLNPFAGSGKPKPKAQPLDTKAAGIDDLVGSTRKDDSAWDKLKEWHHETFVYMYQVKDKTFNVNNHNVSGNKFIAEIDHYRVDQNEGYLQAEGKIKNAIEHITDKPGYSALEQIKDITQYLLYADYLRRAKEGMPVPGDLTIPELQAGVKVTSAWMRSHPDLRKGALNIRNLLMEIGDELHAAGLIEGKRRQYYPHQVLDFINDVYGVPIKVKTPRRGYAQEAHGSVREIETDLVKALDHHMKTIARHNAIDKLIKRVVTEFGDNQWQPGDKIPAGYALYQPKSGHEYFQAYSVPEQAVLQAALQKILLNVQDPWISVALSNLKQVLAVGRPRKTYLLPEEIAGYLGKLYDPRFLGIEGPMGQILQMWKGAVTASAVNPAVMAFHVRNTVGDFEALMREDPAAAGYIKQSIHELWMAKKGNPTKDFLTAKEWGTIGAGFYGSELGMKGDFLFQRRFSKDLGSRILTRTPIASEGVKYAFKYGNVVRRLGEGREDILRYAKYLKDTDMGLEPWQAHIENGRVFVNYNHLTQAEKHILRGVLVPFYTFYKANAVNWFQALTGQRGKGTFARAWGLSLGIPLMVATWNYINDQKYEERIQTLRSQDYMANQLHIFTPFVDNKGNKIIIVLPTASNAAQQIFGLSRLPARLISTLMDVNEGKMTMTEGLKAAVTKSFTQDFFPSVGNGQDLHVPRPAKEVLELVNPFIKEGAEQLFNYDLFLGRSITTDDPNAPASDNQWRRIYHLLKITAPPMMSIGRIFSENTDPRVRLIDTITGLVKAPDLYSWAALKDEQVQAEKIQQTIKDPSLRDLREKAKQSLFNEMGHVIYDARLGPEEKRYGQVFTPEQRLRVSLLLRQNTQGNGLTYSAQGKEGLMKLIKDLDDAKQKIETMKTSADPKVQQGGANAEKRLDYVIQGLPKYLALLEKVSDTRIKAALDAVKATSNEDAQNKMYKELTRNISIPPAVDNKLNWVLYGGNVSFIKPRKMVVNK